MTGNIDDINPPRSMRNVVVEVMEYIERLRTLDEHNVLSERPTAFKPYDDALSVIWPELYKTSKQAHLLVAVSIYVEIAERWGFEVPPEIKEMRL